MTDLQVNHVQAVASLAQEEERAGLLELLTPLAGHWRSLIGTTLLAGILGAAGSFLIRPLFTATTTFLPPQQQQSSASAALASLGALAGLGSSAQKSPAEQFASLMQSVRSTDRIIDQFKLMSVYDSEFRFKAREKLAKRTQVSIGKKDGLISVSVEDTDPKRAAAMANQYVDELRLITSTLAVSEAQQRRMFFEKQLDKTKLMLATAQTALQGSGFTSGALKAEPRTTAESYARLKAELTATEVTLETRRQSLADTSPEIHALLAKAQALRSQLAALEQSDQMPAGADADYISKYREFKYQETLFDLLARQFELARVDEAREGALIQVVDPALLPERKSSPNRGLIAVGAAFAGLLFYAVFVVARARMQESLQDPERARRWHAFRAAFRRT